MTDTPLHEMTAGELRDLPWKGVESSNIKAIALHDDALFVRFTTGTVYRYTDHPDKQFVTAAAVHDNLLEADQDPTLSVGKAFSIYRKSGIPAAKIKINE